MVVKEIDGVRMEPWERTLAGKALRAVAFSHDAASLMGIDVGRTITAAYALSSILAGIAPVDTSPAPGGPGPTAVPSGRAR